MNKFINKLLLLAGLLLAQASIAQIKVTGVVTDEQKSPLPGVSVVVKGTTHGVATDFDGNYSIEVPNNAVLEFSSIGYQTLTKKVTTVNWGGKSLVINVLLNSQVQELTDVVIVGYTTSTKKSLVSAVSSVKTEELKEIPVTNITQGLAGRSPGLIVKGSAGLDNRSTISISSNRRGYSQL